jgi:hypothetical protein
MVDNCSDPKLKKQLASDALALSERAEALADAIEDPSVIEKNIRRYQSWLAGGLTDEAHRRMLEDALTDALSLLHQRQRHHSR